MTISTVGRTAQALAGAITLNTGQVCCTATRWMVHESIWDEFIAKVTPCLQAVQIGHGLSAETQMGPVVSRKQQERVLGYVERGQKEGASAVLAGGPAEVPGQPGGYYVKPALLAGDPDNVCAREEIFGPVAYLIPFREEEQVVELVNRSPYGLANSGLERESGACAPGGREPGGGQWLDQCAQPVPARGAVWRARI